MKTKEHFQPYIDAKEKRIDEIRYNSNFSDQQKSELIAGLKNDLIILYRLQLHYKMLELKKTRQRQLIKLHNYETLIN